MRADAEPAPPKVPKKVADAVVPVGDTVEIQVSFKENVHTMRAIHHVAREAGGSGTVLQLGPVLQLGGCAKKASKSPATYLRETVFKGEEPPKLVTVKITGLSPHPIDFVFVEGAFCILAQKLPTCELISASCLLAEALAKDDAGQADEAVVPGEAVTPAARRAASWFAALPSWRGALRQLLSVLDKEQLATMHSWLLGLKSALTIGAAQLAQRLREGSKSEAATARTQLATRAKAAWAFLRENIAKSPVAQRELEACAKLEQRVAAASVAAESAKAKELQQAAQRGDAAAASAAGTSSGANASSDDDEAGPVDPKPLGKAGLKEVATAGRRAADAERREALRDAAVAETRAAAQEVDGAAAGQTSRSLFNNAQVVSHLFADRDPDQTALLVAMFRGEPDLLMHLVNETARTEACEMVKHGLRQAFEPLAVAATARTVLAASLSPRFVDDVIQK